MRFLHIDEQSRIHKMHTKRGNLFACLQMPVDLQKAVVMVVSRQAQRTMNAKHSRQILRTKIEGTLQKLFPRIIDCTWNLRRLLPSL